MAENKRATADSWRKEPFPEQKEIIEISRIFSPQEMALIEMGFIPTEMEDKWFIYYEAPVLHFHRSWTGYEIYRVTLQPENGSFKVTEVEVNRNPQQYLSTDNQFEEGSLNRIIDIFLLGRHSI